MKTQNIIIKIPTNWYQTEGDWSLLSEITLAQVLNAQNGATASIKNDFTIQVVKVDIAEGDIILTFNQYGNDKILE